MGGTFDPIHHGHLVAASEVAAKFGLDEVVFVPTGQPWQKSHKQVSEPEHRYLMTVIATASNPRFTVSRVDVDRPGPTYTIDTLRDLRTQRPDADLFFITGADALAQILSWKDIDELWSLAHFVGVTRPGHVLDGMGRKDVSLLEVPAMAISSTDCRVRVAGNNPVWYGPTYTIDTLRDLRTQRPDADLFFITGADALAQILSWKDIDELWSLAHFVGVTRPGHVLDGMGRKDVSLLEVPAMAISSTDCRVRVAGNNPVWYLVPDGVVQYIAKYGLYAEGSDPVDVRTTETDEPASTE